jgi:hypothetical protein
MARPDDQRAAFDVPAEVAYFDTADLALQLQAVRAAGEAALDCRSRPWPISEDVSRLEASLSTAIGEEPQGGRR